MNRARLDVAGWLEFAREVALQAGDILMRHHEAWSVSCRTLAAPGTKDLAAAAVSGLGKRNDGLPPPRR